MIIVRLLSPGPWLVGTTKVYPGVGADIVMESITLRTVPEQPRPYFAAVPDSAAVTGSVMVNAAPPSGAVAASMLPPCSRRTVLQMLRPRPVPRPGRLVV